MDARYKQVTKVLYNLTFDWVVPPATQLGLSLHREPQEQRRERIRASDYT